jgi:hypothetical protein
MLAVQQQQASDRSVTTGGTPGSSSSSKCSAVVGLLLSKPGPSWPTMLLLRGLRGSRRTQGTAKGQMGVRIQAAAGVAGGRRAGPLGTVPGCSSSRSTLVPGSSIGGLLGPLNLSQRGREYGTDLPSSLPQIFTVAPTGSLAPTE